MTLEPWMIRTGLVLLGINCVNVCLYYVALRRERLQQTAQPAGEDASAPLVTPSTRPPLVGPALAARAQGSDRL